jgi:hypothetical protein
MNCLTQFRIGLFLLGTTLSHLVCAQAIGPYAPEVGVEGTTAVSKDSTEFVAWATHYKSPVAYGSEVDVMWQTPTKALGKAEGSTMEIVCLGNGGQITLFCKNGIRNGDGWDFAVFENAYSDYFLELAYVEVSSDGINFVRFPSDSLTAQPVPRFGELYPDEIDGLAGKYRAGYGTPFDLDTLSNLPESSVLDLSEIYFIRIVDITGDGSCKDSLGNPIYDPYPTYQSAGFDLDALGVRYTTDSLETDTIDLSLSISDDNSLQLSWTYSEFYHYTVMKADLGLEWLTLGTFDPANGLIENGRAYWNLLNWNPIEAAYFKILRTRIVPSDCLNH